MNVGFADADELCGGKAFVEGAQGRTFSDGGISLTVSKIGRQEQNTSIQLTLRHEDRSLEDATLLAGLRQVPRELHEAASVDGAGVFRRFRHVTLPLLTPLIFFNILMTTINAFQAFTPAYVVSNGSGTVACGLIASVVRLAIINAF